MGACFESVRDQHGNLIGGDAICRSHLPKVKEKRCGMTFLRITPLIDRHGCRGGPGEPQPLLTRVPVAATDRSACRERATPGCAAEPTQRAIYRSSESVCPVS